MTYLLDACALIAYLEEENGEGYEVVRDLLDRAALGDCVVRMSIVNLTETHYDLIRRDGMEMADTTMREVEALPIEVIRTISGKVSRTAARFKVQYDISLADTFLCAAAQNLADTIVTKDGEMKAIEQAESLPILWLPSRPKK